MKIEINNESPLGKDIMDRVATVEVIYFEGVDKIREKYVITKKKLGKVRKILEENTTEII